MKNILLVDDEKIIRQVLAEGLNYYMEDWNILTAENGKKGEAIVESQPVDLIMTDLRMPVSDGYELLAYVQKNKPHIPVIAMTADYSFDVEQRALHLGARQCIQKPFHLLDIVDKIKRNLS